MAVAVYEEIECRKNCPAQETNLPPETKLAVETGLCPIPDTSGISISSCRGVLPASPTPILENLHESGELNLNLPEGGKGGGSVERVFTGDDDDTGGIGKVLSWNSGDCDEEEGRDAFSEEGLSDKVSAECREGDCFVSVGVEEATEMAAEGGFEDGMRAEIKEGKGTDGYESGEDVVTERVVKREIEEKATEGKLVPEKEHKVAPKRKNIRKRRRSAKPHCDKEANSSAFYVETVLSWLLTVFLSLQAFSPRVLCWSPSGIFCVFMLWMACGTEGVFIDTSNDHLGLSCIACKNPGCAAAVTKIWCGKDELLKGLQIPHCTSVSRKPKTACQHHGLAFVLLVKEANKCDMENIDVHVPSDKTECPPLLEATQDSKLDTVQGIYSDTTLPPPPLNGSLFAGVIVTVLGLIGAAVAVVYLIRRKQQGASRNRDEGKEMSALSNSTNQDGGPAYRDNTEEMAVNMLDNEGAISSNEGPQSHLQK